MRCPTLLTILPALALAQQSAGDKDTPPPVRTSIVITASPIEPTV